MWRRLSVGAAPAKSLRYVVLAAVLLTRCATLIHNEFEEVPVTSTPTGADVTLDCGRGPNRLGITPITVVLRRGDTNCSVTISKSGFVGTRTDFHRLLSSAALADVAAGAIAAGIAASTDIDFSAQNGTTSGGTVNVSASGSGSISPAAAGGVVFGVTALVDAASGAIYAHSPKRVDVVLRPKP